MKAFKYDFADGVLHWLDQTKLPSSVVWKRSDRDTLDEDGKLTIAVSKEDRLYAAISRLEVRGAPFLGVFGAYAAYLYLDKIVTGKQQN